MKDDNYIQNLCLHTHNTYCDGKESIRNLVLSAIKQGVKQLGISSHAPLKTPTEWSMDISQLHNYRDEIEELKKQYSNDIELFTSLEIDYIPGQTYNFSFFREQINLDYIIGSVHLVLNKNTNQLWFIDGDKKSCLQNMNHIFNADYKQAIQAYFSQTRELIITQKPDIIGHMDKVIMNTSSLFDSQEKWYQEEILKTLEVIKSEGTIVEANTRGLYKEKWQDTFPSMDILNLCYQMKIPIMINSDAHASGELTAFYDETRKKLKEIGFTHQIARLNGGWCNISL